MALKQQATAAKPATQLTEKELEQLREVRVSIDLKGLLKAWDFVTKKGPFSLYQTVARKLEGFTKKMMVGNSSLFGMPVGIILRNTARAAHNLSAGKYGHTAQVVGGVAIAGAVVAAGVVGGPLIAGALGAGTLVAVVGGVASSAAATMFWKPVYTAGTLAASTLMAAGVAVFSTLIAAPANLLVGFRRSKASLKGVKLSEEQLAAREAEFDRRSPSANYQRQMEDQVNYGLKQLNPVKKEEIYLNLKAEYDAAAQKAPATPAPAAPAAAGGVRVNVPAKP